jgi:predicted regulator of Ras-like GTPase activity (Roadblock/LC7/MglB family)
VGHLRFVRGDLVWADAGELQGDDAFVALTSPRTGRVQPEAWNGQTARNITQPLANLIFTAMTQRDRANPGDPALASPSLPMAGARAAAVAPVLAPAAAPPTTPVLPPQAQAQAQSPAHNSDARGQPAGNGTSSGAQTGVLQPLAPVQISRVRAVVERMAEQLPQPGGAAVVRADGAVVAQRWLGEGEPTSGVYAHLAASGQAALRGLLLGGWSDLQDVRITTAARAILVRRVGRSERAALAIAIVPRDADLNECHTLMATHDGALLDALR